MAKIFRKLRHKLLSENRVKKYLIYALGEIVLVVIGILIALWINNTNQNRQLQEKERTYLVGLQKEFQVSKQKLEELIRVNTKNYQGAHSLAQMTHAPDSSLSEARFSQLLLNTFSNDIVFDSNNALLQEMINSGSLNHLSSLKLRMHLTTWMVTLQDIKRQETDLNEQRVQVLDLFRDNNLSIRTILDYTGTAKSFGLKPSGTKQTNLHLLQSNAFENNVLMFMLTNQGTTQAHYQPLMEDLDIILDQIGIEIEKLD